MIKVGQLTHYIYIFVFYNVAEVGLIEDRRPFPISASLQCYDSAPDHWLRYFVETVELFTQNCCVA